MPVKLAIGLGNIGRAYAHTYHNVGFFTVDFIRRATPRNNAAVLQLEKTTGYMNESGSAVRTLMKRHRVDAREILIIHDDSDLAIGAYKLSFGRGAAGHRGVLDVIRTLRTKDFWRLRIGIRNEKRGQPQETTRRMKAEEFVLWRMSAHDEKLVEAALTNALPAILSLSTRTST